MTTGYAVGDELRDRIAGNLRGFANRELSDDGLRRAAVAVTLTGDDQGRACFLLTRRGAGLRAHAAQWALPGGRVDTGESVAAAALRELEEEVGVVCAPTAVLGRLDDYGTRSSFLITPVVVWAGAECALNPNPAEVSAVYRIPVTELDHPGSPRLLSIPESDRPIIQMRVRGRYINAPTAAILYQFREVGLHGRETRVADYDQPVFAWR